MKAPVRLCMCSDSLKSLLLDSAINNKISCAGSNNLKLFPNSDFAFNNNLTF